jgi:hypothetical protein
MERSDRGSFEGISPRPLGVQGDNSSPDVRITSGELALNDSFGKVLPLSIVVRLER